MGLAVINSVASASAVFVPYLGFWLKRRTGSWMPVVLLSVVRGGRGMRPAPASTLSPVPSCDHPAVGGFLTVRCCGLCPLHARGGALAQVAKVLAGGVYLRWSSIESARSILAREDAAKANLKLAATAGAKAAGDNDSGTKPKAS